MPTRSWPMVSCLSRAWAIATLVPTPSVEVASSGLSYALRNDTSNSPAKPPTPPSTSGPWVLPHRRLHEFDGEITGGGVDAGLAVGGGGVVVTHKRTDGLDTPATSRSALDRHSRERLGCTSTGAPLDPGATSPACAASSASSPPSRSTSRSTTHCRFCSTAGRTPPASRPPMATPPHVQGQRPGARGVPHPRHAHPARHDGPRPRSLRHARATRRTSRRPSRST